MKTKSGHALYDVLSTPVMMCKFFSVEVSRMIRRKLPPVCQKKRAVAMDERIVKMCTGSELVELDGIYPALA
eukprot:1147457-Pelagomonas_calceolata.AAC.3